MAHETLIAVRVCMGSTSIRLSEEAKRRLELQKQRGESFDDVILRLTERDRWAGFGVLSDSDTATRDGMDEIRRRMREGTETTDR